MKKRGKGRRVVLQLLIAMPTLTFGLSIAAAKLILSGIIKQDAMNICVYVIAGITSLILSIYCAIRMPQKKGLWAIITSAAYALCLMLGNMLFFGIGFDNILPVVGSVMICGCLGAVIGAAKPRRFA